jgi:hypothetical protein
LLDYLAADQKLDPAARVEYERNLADSVKFLLSLRLPTGRFYPLYRVADGRGTDSPAPYSDGETLFALTRYAKERNDPAVRTVVLESAAVMYGAYVKAALRADPHSADAIAFYQWGTMAVLRAPHLRLADTRPYAARAIAMARWMTDVNKVVNQPGNMGPAYEGLALAWELARLTGDAKKPADHRRHAQPGLSKLLTWQIGNPGATSSGASPRDVPPLPQIPRRRPSRSKTTPVSAPTWSCISSTPRCWFAASCSVISSLRRCGPRRGPRRARRHR